MTDVWEFSKHKGSDLLVLLAIADHVGDQNGMAWPSIPHLAEKCRMSHRNTRYCVKALIASGELLLVRQGDGNKSSVYRLNIEGGKVCRGATQRTQGGNRLPPNHQGTIVPPKVPQGGRVGRTDTKEAENGQIG